MQVAIIFPTPGFKHIQKKGIRKTIRKKSSVINMAEGI